MTQHPFSDGKLHVSADIPWGDPATIFEHWTRAELLSLWWPQSAVIGDGVGGPYHLIWSGENAFAMQGEITAFDPGRELGFTWKWTFQPADAPALDVHVTFEPLPEQGTRVSVTHGPVEEGSGAMNGLLGGWDQFLGTLEDLPNLDDEEGEEEDLEAAE